MKISSYLKEALAALVQYKGIIRLIRNLRTWKDPDLRGVIRYNATMADGWRFQARLKFGQAFSATLNA